jgi:deoxyribonuclease-4
MVVRPVGAHVSGSGGIARALQRARERGGDALQIFSSNPRGWALPAGVPEDGPVELPLFLHAPYLVNLASPDPVTLSRSVSSVAFALARGARLGAAGVVVHAGHAVGASRSEALGRTARALRGLLDLAAGGSGASPETGGVDLVVELTAGGRGALACRPEEAAEIIEALDGDPRLRLCLDTCHLWAAGVDWGTEPARRELAAGLAALGPGRVALVHVNDSADPLGSRRDRHRNLGQGTVPVDALPPLLALPELAGAVLVTETPGTAAEQTADVAAVRQALTSLRAATSRRTGRQSGG